MSVQTQINRIASAKSAISTAITNKGVTVPSGTKIDGMATLITQIQTGTDTSDATLNSNEQLLSGVTAYSNGTKYTGTYTAPVSSVNGKTGNVVLNSDDVGAASASSLATYVRPNLLDNWYFVGGGSQQGGGQFPINQRGQTRYTGGNIYGIDRWQSTGSNLVIAVESGCLSYTPSATFSTVRQYIEDPFSVFLMGKGLGGAEFYLCGVDFQLWHTNTNGTNNLRLDCNL